MVLAGLAATTLPAQSTFDQADPMIGTGGEGHTFPGAVAPFGMVQFSPDTDATCVLRACYGHAAGYRYEDYSHAEDIAGLIGQYIHGNEPSHHVAYLYSYAGAPWERRRG